MEVRFLYRGPGGGVGNIISAERPIRIDEFRAYASIVTSPLTGSSVSMAIFIDFGVSFVGCLTESDKAQISDTGWSTSMCT